MLLEKCSKRHNFIAFQNRENGVPVPAGIQLAVLREGNCWASKLCRFGVDFGSVEAQCGHQREPKEHFERVQKQSTKQGEVLRCQDEDGPWRMES